MSARHDVFVSDNIFAIMDFYNPWPNITAETYDQIREEAAGFIVRLAGE